MKESLQGMTRLVLLVSAVVQTIFGVLNIAAPDLSNALLWPAPLEPWPAFTLQFNGALYLACALGALVAFSENTWPAARTYLAIGGSYVALSLIFTLVRATSAGVPLIHWVYAFLAILYLPVLAYVLVTESRRAAAPRAI